MSNNPSRKQEWASLAAHHTTLSSTSMRDLFTRDDKRFETFSLKVEGLLFDYSKNKITEETLQKLFALAAACNLEGWRNRMFTGDKINTT